ncbi:hypothetical protein [Mesorhizobium muleiense]|uniref:hypothetical protein n=1 Tax=Mesorhizobium muleiense TaxID=1004279 RepID=UPI0039AFD892
MEPRYFFQELRPLLAGEIAAKFLAALLASRVRQQLSSEHFWVGGTLAEIWAQMKSFPPKEDGDRRDDSGGGHNFPVDFRGEKRSNDTRASTTDPDAMHYRTGTGMEAKWNFIGHSLMENRSGLLVDAVSSRSGHAEPLEVR